MVEPESKGNFTGQLTTKAQKRITNERQSIEKDKQALQESGIFIHWADELNKATALIVGPEGTPYEHGFYLFDIKMPDDYPWQPPHVNFKTGDGRVRFNPNLYVDGKVCLSILGTWPGPAWNATLSLGSVLLSIQSLLNEHPIQNEPGYENASGEVDETYSEIIRYENIAVGVVRMLKNTPPEFQNFRPQMRKIFLNRAEGYLKTLEAYASKEDTSARSPIWNFPVCYRPKELKTELVELQASLEAESEAGQENEACTPTTQDAAAVAPGGN